MRIVRVPTIGHRHEATVHPVLGTTAHIQLDISANIVEVFRAGAIARTIEQSILDEAERLESMMSVFRTESLFARWRRGDDVGLSIELRELLMWAIRWSEQSNGAFNPAVGAASELWKVAAETDQRPSDAALDSLATQRIETFLSIVETPAGAQVSRVRPCPHLTLHAIAKGFIVDRCAAAATRNHHTKAAVINIGGDLVHRGLGTTIATVQDPLRPYDNADPIDAIRIGNEAIATSGGTERGWRIANRWYSHVLDPRTARPVDHIASASVVAPSALEADTVATVLSVLRSDERGAFVQTLDQNIGYLVVAADGTIDCNDSWIRRRTS